MRIVRMIVVVTVGFVAATRAEAQDAAIDADACVKYLYRRLSSLDPGPRNGGDRARMVRRIVAGAEVCGVSADDRRALRRAARAPYPRDEAILEPLVESHPREECRPPRSYGGDVLAVGCRPHHPAVGGLVTSLGVEQSLAHDRRYLVAFLDALTRASPRLVAAAQILWVFANWDRRCVPSPVFLRMRADLRAGHARFEAYPE